MPLRVSHDLTDLPNVLDSLQAVRLSCVLPMSRNGHLLTTLATVLSDENDTRLASHHARIAGRNIVQNGIGTDTGNRGVNDPKIMRWTAFEARSRGRSRHGSSPSQSGPPIRAAQNAARQCVRDLGQVAEGTDA
jgi:hypothetical protein